jgi:NTE family protein
VDANAAGGRRDLLVLVGFSGGGKRSAAFGHGVLRGMRQVPVRLDGAPGSTLLEEVDFVAGVSGGSFPAAHYALHGETSFETFPDEFLHRDINAYIFGTYLLPWNWEWLVNPYYGTNDRMAEIYDRLMFRGATYADLGRRRRPALSVNATDIGYGLPFGFTAFNFDLICSDLASFPLARAVAASNGFPGLFTPITLQNHRGKGCLLPPPPRPDRTVVRADFRTRQIAETMDRYLDPEQTKWIHLMDGGISDNLALRGLLNSLILLDQQPQAYAEALRRLRRVVLISVDGQAVTDPSLPRRRVVGGLLDVFDAVSGTQIDAYNVETLMLAELQLSRLVAHAKEARCRQGPVVDGHRCDDVLGLLVRISLSDFPNGQERERLQAIPTGLTIAPEYVEMLVRAGESMARDDEELRRFLMEEEPARRSPTAAPVAAGRRGPPRSPVATPVGAQGRAP